MNLNRRQFAASAAMIPLAGMKSAEAVEEESPSFTFVHLTDPHVQPERGGADGLKQCLRAVNALKPDFVITGGDLIMDALHVTEERAALEWKLCEECFAELEVPAHHVIGNHDIGGWSSRAKMDASSPWYGKSWFREHYGQGKTYRSFDHKGWHFILLDSIGQIPGSPDYRGWIDAEQLKWLEADLAQTGATTPIVIVTHIPFHTAMHQLTSNPTLQPLGPYATVSNFHTVWKLLKRHNVQVILSGHGHVREQIQLGGLTHIQSGAVCGLWWKGDVHGEDEAFNVIECSAGGFTSRFESFGWEVRRK